MAGANGNLIGKKGADSQQNSKESGAKRGILGSRGDQRHDFFTLEERIEAWSRGVERLIALLRGWWRVFPPGKDRSNTTLRWDHNLDRAQDSSFAIQKDDIAVFAHDLGDKAHHVFTGRAGKYRYPLSGLLLYLHQTRALQVLTEQHDERARRGERLGQPLRGQVKSRVGGIGGEQQPVLLPAIHGERHGMSGRLYYLLYPAAGSHRTHLVSNGCHGKRVKRHTVGSLVQTGGATDYVPNEAGHA